MNFCESPVKRGYKPRMSRNRKHKGITESRVIDGLSLHIMARLSAVMAIVFEKWRATMLIIVLMLLISVIILAIRSPR